MALSDFATLRRYGTSPKAMGTVGQHPEPVSGRIAVYPTSTTRAFGAAECTARSTAAIFGAVAVIRAWSWSTPPAVYRSRHGEPNGLPRLSWAHCVTMLVK